MSLSSSIDAAFGRERSFVPSGLVLVTLPARAYLGYLAWEMGAMGAELAMPRLRPWSAWDFLLTLLMWAVMMVAMMVPSAEPMILMFSTVHRRRREQGEAFIPTGIFLSGYVVVWSGFSALAVSAQWALHNAALLSPMMVSTGPVPGAALLPAAGLFQFTPLEEACLVKCRTPMGFIMTEWRESTRGAFVMGLRHGIYCTGCCWASMALLFVGGVMNLLWVAMLAGFVLVEKVLPGGPLLGRIGGVLLAGWGGWLGLISVLS